MPCAECGQSVERALAVTHQCDPERLLECRMRTRHHEIATFDHGLRTYLSSHRGRFETWLAAREVRRSS